MLSKLCEYCPRSWLCWLWSAVGLSKSPLDKEMLPEIEVLHNPSEEMETTMAIRVAVEVTLTENHLAVDIKTPFD